MLHPGQLIRSLAFVCFFQYCVQPQVYNVKNHGPCPQGVHNIKGEKMGANQGQLNTVKSCDQDGPDMLR